MKTLTEEQIKKLVEKIEAQAAKSAHFDREDFNACDYSGGNFDDAYSLGVSDGETSFARDLLMIFEEGDEEIKKLS